jgi:hypothetical protein
MLDCLVNYFGLDENDRPGLRRYFSYHILAGPGPTSESGVAWIVDLDSIEGHRVAVSGFLKRSAGHRIAFAAALAERLFPLYAAFTAATGKGRPVLLRGALDAVWEAAKGRAIDTVRLQDYLTKHREGALAKEEADAWSAWSAWRVLGLALECCGSAKNTRPAEEAAVVAFERVAGPGARKEPRIWKEMLHTPQIYNEIVNQTGLLMRLGTIVAMEDQTVEALRRSVAT